ncbi:hypothetical protein ACSUZJ_15255 [Telluria sp. B2]|jgi:hypothetical protein
MKKLIVIAAALAALTGCATQYPGPANYGTRGYAQAADPDGWQVVSVTPVPLGTGARAGDAGVVTSSPVVVNPAPASPVYVPQTIYAPAPVVVQDPYWYPPVSIGLGFSFGRSWGGRHHYHPRPRFHRR